MMYKKLSLLWDIRK